MNESSIKDAVVSFHETGESEFKKTYSVSGEEYTVEIIKVNVEKSSTAAFESLGASPISAMPSGTACGCCSGTGRSS